MGLDWFVRLSWSRVMLVSFSHSGGELGSGDVDDV